MTSVHPSTITCVGLHEHRGYAQEMELSDLHSDDGRGFSQLEDHAHEPAVTEQGLPGTRIPIARHTSV